MTMMVMMVVMVMMTRRRGVGDDVCVIKMADTCKHQERNPHPQEWQADKYRPCHRRLMAFFLNHSSMTMNIDSPMSMNIVSSTSMNIDSSMSMSIDLSTSMSID